MSESLGELYAAMAKAQGAIVAAIKDKSNPHFKSSYADLAGVWEACRKPLSDNGLSVMQFPLVSGDGWLHMETIVAHSSGQSVSRVFAIPLERANAHGYGSAITYARRFCLAAAVGVAPDDDDDGNAASQKKTGEPTRNVTPTASSLDRVRPDRLDHVTQVADEVRAFANAGAFEDAYLTIENCDLDADEMVHFWTLFDSKIRSAIKKVRQEIAQRAAIAKTQGQGNGI